MSNSSTTQLINKKKWSRASLKPGSNTLYTKIIMIRWYLHHYMAFSHCKYSVHMYTVYQTYINPPFPPAGKYIRRDSPTASRQTTLWICLVRSASPSPRPQSSCSLPPLRELLKFLETFLCFVTKHLRCSNKTKDLLLFSSLTELQLKGLDEVEEPWTDIDLINRVFCCKKTALSGTTELIIQ